MHLRVSKSPHLSLPAPASLRCCLWICHFFLLDKKGLFLKIKPGILYFFSGHVDQYFLGLVSILQLDDFARCCLYKIAGDPEISLRLYVTTTGSAHSLCFPPHRSCHRLETKPFLKNHQGTLLLPSHHLQINRRQVCRRGIRKKSRPEGKVWKWGPLPLLGVCWGHHAGFRCF